MVEYGEYWYRPDDTEPKLNFGSCPCGPYKRMARAVYANLKPGEIIVPSFEEKLDLRVILIANKNLTSRYFQVRRRDETPVAGVDFPGKSAHLDYITSEIGGGTEICRTDVSEIVRHCFGKEMDRRDAMYQASISDLRDIGYQVFLAPTKAHLLHVRMVHERTIGTGDLPTPHDVQKLVKVFHRVYPPKK